MNKTVHKWINKKLEREVKMYQKYLQTIENTKYGRKAKNISFIDASSKPKDLANFILGRSK